MQSNSSDIKTTTLPRRIRVQEVLDARYPDRQRPLSWDLRKNGIDRIRTAEGESLNLLSDGGQSVPKPGWVLLLTDGDAAIGYRWTLYGLPPTN